MIRKGIALLLIFSLMSACSAAAQPTAETAPAANNSGRPMPSDTAVPTSAPKESAKKEAEPTNMIKWDDFFDDGKQDRPSAKFQSLNGQNVVIDGFMGEILSVGNGWFLLIPKPGAECPFDNGDQSYWNSIMIVFVKDKHNLRYTQGALRLHGRLEVGAKKDESGYTTMFRLYDAEFTKK